MLYHRCDPLLAGKKNQYHAQPKDSDIDLSPDNEARVQARTCPTADSYKGTQAKPDIWHPQYSWPTEQVELSQILIPEEVVIYVAARDFYDTSEYTYGW